MKKEKTNISRIAMEIKQNILLDRLRNEELVAVCVLLCEAISNIGKISDKEDG